MVRAWPPPAYNQIIIYTDGSREKHLNFYSVHLFILNQFLCRKFGLKKPSKCSSLHVNS